MVPFPQTVSSRANHLTHYIEDQTEEHVYPPSCESVTPTPLISTETMLKRSFECYKSLFPETVNETFWHFSSFYSWSFWISPQCGSSKTTSCINVGICFTHIKLLVVCDRINSVLRIFGKKCLCPNRQTGCGGINHWHLLKAFTDDIFGYRYPKCDPTELFWHHVNDQVLQGVGKYHDDSYYFFCLLKSL